MKRILSLLVCFVMLITSAVSADSLHENADIETVLASVKSRIMPTDVFESFTSEKTTDELSSTYRFVWTTNKEKYSRLRVVVNNEDIIINYSYSDETESYDLRPNVSKMPSKEAITYALGHIYTLNPKLEGTIRISAPEYDELHSNDYTFNVQRMYAGIDVYGDSGYVTISGDGRVLKSFYMNYTPNLDFKKEEYLTREEAASYYAEKIPLKLMYEILYTKENSKNVSLVYVPSADYNTYISATDGSVFSPQEYNIYNGITAKNAAVSGGLLREEAADKIAFSEAERNEISEVNGLIGTENAEKLIRENKALDFDQNLKLKSASINHDFYEDGKYYYNMTFYSENEEESTNVSCDAKTGEILYYYRYKYNTAPDAITDEELEIIAAEKVKQLAGKYFENEKDKYVLKDSKNGSLTFIRYVNGIECPQNEIRIKISKKDSRIDMFSITNDNVIFPDSTNVISPYMIHKVVFGECEYSLKFVSSFNKEINKYDAVAVYMFDDYYIKYDAITGNMATNTEENILSDYTDIDGHYAEDMINTLKRFGIGFSGGLFEPDKVITMGEYLTLLNTVFDYGVTPVIFKENYDYEKAYDYGVRSRLIGDGEDLEASLTREKACVMLVKALGYDEVANLDDIYISKFTDVDSNLGYISILHGMGVVKGDGIGNFNPNDNLTRAGACVMLYNYLSK